MMKLLTTLTCLACFVLNTSMVGVNSIEGSAFSAPQFKEETGFELQDNLNQTFAKGFKLPKAAPKAQQPKGNAPKGGHDKNVREGNREKHEKADGRRQKEQAKAEEKKENNKKKK